MKCNRKWKIPHTLREKNLPADLIKESQIKKKTVVNWSLQKKKESVFNNVFLY